MKKIKYNFIKDEAELILKINNLDKIANEYLIKIEDLHMEDLFFMSVIDKSIKLIDSFLFALEKKEHYSTCHFNKGSNGLCNEDIC